MTPVRKLVALTTAWSASEIMPLRVVAPDKRPMPTRIQLRCAGVATTPSRTFVVEYVAELQFLVEFGTVNARLLVRI